MRLYYYSNVIRFKEKHGMTEKNIVFFFLVSSSSVTTVELASGNVSVLSVRTSAFGQREHFHPDRDRNRSPQSHSKSTQVRRPSLNNIILQMT